MAGSQQSLFTIYTQMPQRLSPRTWRVIRWISVLAALAVAAIALFDPPLGLRLFWGIYVPLLPVVFLTVPGLWRNVCPMAALNQIPRTVGFSRGLTLPPRVQQFTPLVSATLLILMVGLRRVILDSSGLGLAIFLVVVLVLAFIGGVFFKGKSGWCSQFCPMLQVERFYGQAPLRVLPNSHCRPCVGCNKNCYDFNPTAAYLADLHDENPRLGTNRRLFAGALPWLIGAFFTQPDLHTITLTAALAVYGHLLLYIAAGIGVFMLLEAVLPLTSQQLVMLHVVAAINLFYGFGAPLVLAPLGSVGGPLAVVVQVTVAVVSLLWLQRAWPREQAFLTAGSEEAPPRAGEAVMRLHNAARAGRAEVVFSPGPTVVAKPGETLLDVAEANKVPLEAGCRMGMCGADPVRILEGAENLSAMASSERSTLERLGLVAGCRLACVARVRGTVTVATSPATASAVESAASAPTAAGFVVDTSVQRVVIVGAGAAGVTAALEIRALHPEAAVTVIGEESYDYYNRMAIGKLVAEATSIDKLYLMPQDWPATKGVSFRRGVTVTAIEPGEHRVLLENGESLPYDRLLLATGAQSARPEMENSSLTGVFVLRTIDDAVDIQQHIRRRRCRTVLVVGGGLLGLEVAHSISHLGVRVYVIDRNEWPLSRQLDRPAGDLIWLLMNELGVQIVPGVQVRRLRGSNVLEGVELSDGRTLQAEACVVAAGIVPNTELARAAGLAVARGVLVDDHLRSSDPHIYAAGDVAECGGRLGGLWPTSVEQAQIAVANLLGGDRCYTPAVPPTRLKVAAIDLLSAGEIKPREETGSEVVIDETANRQYRKLVLDGTHICGGILVGHASLADSVSKAVEARLDVEPMLARLRDGDWSVLDG